MGVVGWAGWGAREQVWKGTGGGTARVKMLEPGKAYRFRVRPTNCDGLEGAVSESVASFFVHFCFVLFLLYFVLSCFVLFCFVLFVLFRLDLSCFVLFCFCFFHHDGTASICLAYTIILMEDAIYWCDGVQLRGAILNRTYGTHKNLNIALFLLPAFGPIYYGPPK